MPSSMNVRTTDDVMPLTHERAYDGQSTVTKLTRLIEGRNHKIVYDIVRHTVPWTEIAHTAPTT